MPGLERGSATALGFRGVIWVIRVIGFIGFRAWGLGCKGLGCKGSGCKGLKGLGSM